MSLLTISLSLILLTITHSVMVGLLHAKINEYKGLKKLPYIFNVKSNIQLGGIVTMYFITAIVFNLSDFVFVRFLVSALTLIVASTLLVNQTIAKKLIAVLHVFIATVVQTLILILIGFIPI